MLVIRKFYLAILGYRPQASAQPGNGKLYLAILGHRPQATIRSTAQYSATGHDLLNCPVLGHRPREIGRPMAGLIIREIEKVRK